MGGSENGRQQGKCKTEGREGGGGGTTGGGRPAANDRAWRRWWIEGPEGMMQGEWRWVGGLGTLRFVSLPGDRGHVICHA